MCRPIIYTQFFVFFFYFCMFLRRKAPIRGTNTNYPFLKATWKGKTQHLQRIFTSVKKSKGKLFKNLGNYFYQKKLSLKCLSTINKADFGGFFLPTSTAYIVASYEFRVKNIKILAVNDVKIACPHYLEQEDFPSSVPFTSRGLLLPVPITSRRGTIQFPDAKMSPPSF